MDSQKRKTNDVTLIIISDKQTFIENQCEAQIIKYFGIQLFTSRRIYINNIVFGVTGTLSVLYLNIIKSIENNVYILLQYVCYNLYNQSQG